MTYNPLISIIVPVYNVEKYLEKCINSLLGQTYKNLEIILIDDGSEDNCPRMCDEWSNNDSRIKVIHKENEGQGVARNIGISESNGDYIMFIDSDDYIDSTMVEKLVKATAEGKFDLAMCGYIVEGRLNKFKAAWFETEKTFNNDNLILEYITSPFRIPCGPVCKLFKRERVANIKFPPFRSVEDAYAMPDFLGACRNAIAIPEYLYYYVQREGSTEQKGFNEDRLKVIDCRVSLMNFIRERYPHYYNKVAAYKLIGIFSLIIKIYTEGKTKMYSQILSSLEKDLFDEYENLKTEFSDLEFVQKIKRYISNPAPFRRKWKYKCFKNKIKRFIKSIIITIKNR